MIQGAPRATHLALGVHTDGNSDALGIRIGRIKGAKFSLNVFNERRTRGADDILTAVVAADGYTLRLAPRRLRGPWQRTHGAGSNAGL